MATGQCGFHWLSHCFLTAAALYSGNTAVLLSQTVVLSLLTFSRAGPLLTGFPSHWLLIIDREEGVLLIFFKISILHYDDFILFSQVDTKIVTSYSLAVRCDC